MKLQFDANQQYQLDAVAAVADLFDGQPCSSPNTRSSYQHGTIAACSPARSRQNWGRQQSAAERRTADKNTRLIQERNEIEIADPESAWKRGTAAPARLSARISPSRWRPAPARPTSICGRSSSLHSGTASGSSSSSCRAWPSARACSRTSKSPREHFQALYNNLPFESLRLRRQEGEPAAAVRHQQHAADSGHQHRRLPQELHRHAKTSRRATSSTRKATADRAAAHRVRAGTQPIVIIDEPQSVDTTDRSRRRRSRPESALHAALFRHPPQPLQPVYRLDPIRAYELRLVKQIVVDSATTPRRARTTPSCAWRRSSTRTASRPSCDSRSRPPNGPKEKSVTVKNGSDLYESERQPRSYRDGFIVTEIDATPGAEFIRFDSGVVLALGQEQAACARDLAGADSQDREEAPGEGASGSRRGAEGLEPVLHRPRGELPRATTATQAVQGQICRGL